MVVSLVSFLFQRSLPCLALVLLIVHKQWNTSLKNKQRENHTFTSAYNRQSIRELELYKPFNETNPHTSTGNWCPYAKCINSPRCSPCKRRFLIEIATGRSGSTSLLRMLGSLPNVRMSGENNNQMLYLYKMTSDIEDSPTFQYEKTSSSSGNRHEEISRGDFACPVQSMIEAINPPPLKVQKLGEDNFDDSKTILGFKTIRFSEGWPSDEVAVQFVKDKFPCSKIVVNINSNVEKQSHSNWWGKKGKSSFNVLQNLNDRMHGLTKLFGPERSFLLDCDEWGEDPKTVNDLIHWLGFRGCTIQKVLHDNYHGKVRVEKRRKIFWGKDCRYVGDDISKADE